MRKSISFKRLGIFFGLVMTASCLTMGVPVYAEDMEPADTELQTGWAVPTAVVDETEENVGLEESELTESAVYNALIAMKDSYPEGMTWTNDNEYGPYYHYVNGRKIQYTGSGCAGFAFLMSNTAFGDLPDREHTNWDDIRVGDILRINNDGHSVVVLSVDDDTITIVEGNFNSSIHWGRTLSRTNLKNGTGTYIWTRWNDVYISEDNFPDAVFRSYVAEVLDTDGNNYLSKTECNSVTNISLNNSKYLKKIASLQGIEYFPNLTTLDCPANLLTSLDMSSNTKLTVLNCTNNALTSLNVSKNTALISLNCSDNKLTELDVSACTQLKDIYCQSNQLSKLTLGNHSKMTELNCMNNNLTTLSLGGCTKLTTLAVNSNRLTGLDVTKCTELVNIYGGTNQLTSIDLTNLRQLKWLSVDSNQLTSLNVNNCTKLLHLECGSNRIKELDMTHNTQLSFLHCESNGLTRLYLTGCGGLTDLDCSANKLTGFDLGSCSGLTTISCGSNQLSYLNLPCDLTGSASVSSQTCTYTETSNLKLDLSEIAYLDVDRITNLKGGSISGTILTATARTITYSYRIGTLNSSPVYMSVTLKLKEAPKIPVTKITLNKTSAKLFIGKTVTLTPTVQPSNATDQIVTWKSMNKNVATVNSKGVVTAKAAGTANIRCIAADGSEVMAVCKVTVTKPVTKITLNKTSAKIFIGNKTTLKATVSPSTATDKTVTWKSSNTKVATVNKTTGVVTAKAVGTATITCTASDGSGVKTTCKITVTKPVTKIKLSTTGATLKVNKKLKLTATVAPSSATNKDVTWKSSDTSIATVSSSGVVTAKKAGTVTITCTAKDGSKVKATCKVKVTK